MKPGHLSADCPLNKVAKGSAAIMEGAASQPPRTYEIRCVEAEGGEVRQRGKPFVSAFGSENFQVVKRGSIPRPSGACLGSWIPTSNNNFRVTPTRNRFLRLTSDRIENMSKPSTSRFQVRPESVEDLPPGTDDGRSGVPSAKMTNTPGTGTPSRNSVVRGRFDALEAAMRELDKREARASNTPLEETADTHTRTHNIDTHQIDEHDFPKLVLSHDIVQRLHSKGFQHSTSDALSFDHDHGSQQAVLPAQGGRSISNNDIKQRKKVGFDIKQDKSNAVGGNSKSNAIGSNAVGGKSKSNAVGGKSISHVESVDNSKSKSKAIGGNDYYYDYNNDTTTSKDMQIGNHRGVKANSPPGGQGGAGLPDGLTRSGTPLEKTLPGGFPQRSRPTDRDHCETASLEVRMLNACTPVTATGLSGDKAHVRTRDVENGTPAPCRELQGPSLVVSISSIGTG